MGLGERVVVEGGAGRKVLAQVELRDGSARLLPPGSCCSRIILVGDEARKSRALPIVPLPHLSGHAKEQRDRGDKSTIGSYHPRSMPRTQK